MLSSYVMPYSEKRINCLFWILRADVPDFLLLLYAQDS